MTNLITKAFQADPVSLQIVRFLLKNKQAMDSAKGIATWWVGCDEVAVQAALDRLIGCGVLNAHTFKSCTLYGLTSNHETRGWLESWFNGAQKGSGGALPKIRALQPSPGSLAVVHATEQSIESIESVESVESNESNGQRTAGSAQEELAGGSVGAGAPWQSGDRATGESKKRIGESVNCRGTAEQPNAFVLDP